ncbi:hypothetical protein JCM14469_40580 [Desulfatiferula olefinivorans]
MKRWMAGLFVLTTMSVLWDGSCGAAPLPQASRFPLMLMVLTPGAGSPDLPENRLALALDLDYSSVFVSKQSAHWTVLMDMELFTVTPGFELRLCPRMSLGFQLPLVGFGAGFLDRPLADYHELGSFPDYGRSDRPHNQFAYAVEKDGRSWMHADTGGLHAADSRLDLKYLFYQASDRTSALLFSVKLPTGDADRGLGSGQTDLGVFSLNRLRRGRLTWTFFPGLIVPHDPDTLGADVHFRTMACLFAGAEVRTSELLQLNAQLNIFTSPLSHTGIDALDRPCVELGLGLFWHLSPGFALSLSFHEDLAGPSPDFTVRTGIRSESLSF